MEYVYLGKIVNTHGLKGEVRILSNFKYKEKVFIKDFPLYIGKKYEKEIISSYRHHKQFEMVTLKGYTDINEVLKYKGLSVYIKREDLDLGKDEYLDGDLIGLKIKVNDEFKGEVVKIEYGAQNKIVVNYRHILYYIPYVCDIIKDINLEEGYIEIIYIKGLLD